MPIRVSGESKEFQVSKVAMDLGYEVEVRSFQPRRCGCSLAL